ncbi:TIGR02444 family protein [Kushneria aurantia]|uniref:TIGR02444 family protein n=1 Tax=Kushneria aurantia TaxID=504092 RepID=A0ABV6G3W3_9GAMM|nr:TIGR02444 family protein [Kushneria aurantia]
MTNAEHCNRYSADLWRFALDLYAAEGVAAACLRLQDDAGIDVCELLWRCWLAHGGLQPAAAAQSALDEVRRWQQQMTAPLRDRRRRLKPLAADNPQLEPLREHLKRAELESEKQALTMLQALAGAPVAGAAFDIVRHHYGLTDNAPRQALDTLIARATAL